MFNDKIKWEILEAELGQPLTQEDRAAFEPFLRTLARLDDKTREQVLDLVEDFANTDDIDRQAEILNEVDRLTAYLYWPWYIRGLIWLLSLIFGIAVAILLLPLFIPVAGVIIYAIASILNLMPVWLLLTLTLTGVLFFYGWLISTTISDISAWFKNKDNQDE